MLSLQSFLGEERVVGPFWEKLKPKGPANQRNETRAGLGKVYGPFLTWINSRIDGITGLTKITCFLSDPIPSIPGLTGITFRQVARVCVKRLVFDRETCFFQNGQKEEQNRQNRRRRGWKSGLFFLRKRDSVHLLLMFLGRIHDHLDKRSITWTPKSDSRL